MQRNNSSEAIETLEGLLDAERHAIRSGEFAGLETLARVKSDLLDQISANPPPDGAAALERVRAKANANQGLLAAALKGVRAAQRRLDMIHRASRSLNTYDSMGRAKSIDSGTGTVERRA